MILFSGLCWLSAGHAQDSSVIMGHSPRVIQSIKVASMVTMKAEGIMYSNSVPAGMLYPFYAGGRISNKLIRNASDGIGTGRAELQGHSILDVSFVDNAGLLFGNKNRDSATSSGRKTNTWSLNYRYTTMYGAGFDRSAFDLVFRGNAPYAGSTLATNDLRLNTLSWNNLGVSRSGRVGSLWVDFGADWVFMRNFQNLHLNNGTLYTSAFGDSLQLGYDLDYTRKDKNTNGLYTLSHGAALQFRISGATVVNLKDKKVVNWGIGVRDLGMVASGQSMGRYTRDSGVSITGWNVPFTPYGIDSNASFQGYFDTLLNRMDPLRQGVRGRVFLPALFDASISMRLNSKASRMNLLYGRIEYRMFQGFIPHTTID